MKGFLYGQTEYNLLNNVIHSNDYFSACKENHFDFISITDPNLYYSYKFYNKALELGIKPIMGLEYNYVYIDNLGSKLLIYAKNKNGFKNLMKISSLVEIKKIDRLDDVLSFSDLAFIFVFNDSIIERLFISHDREALNNLFDIIRKCDGYIGYSLSNKISKTSLNTDIIIEAERLNVKTIPVHQTRYLKNDDRITYEYLLKISGLEYKLDDFDDYSFLNEPEENVMLDNLINSIDTNDYFNHEIKLPKYPNTKGASSKDFLGALCYKGLERRGIRNKNYYQRLEYELGVISKMGYDDYFLIVWDFVKYAKQHNILVGPGRGSAAGSLVSYCLGITEIDPLKYDLLFERFLNPERVSMPDIDTDFPDDKRDLVIDYVKNLYGAKHVCNITAFGTFQIKSSIRELSKAFNISTTRGSSIIDMIEREGYDKLLSEYQNSEMYDFLYVARGIENLPKHISTHAAGIILSSDDLTDIIPLQEGINNLYQAQYEKEDLEHIGLLKMDFLGIKYLSILKQMMDEAGYDLAKLRNIPLNDPKVYKLFQNADTLGLFQFESVGIRKVLRDVKPTSFEDIVAVLALYRPGPMDNIPEYIRRKHGGKFEYLHPDLIPILKSTYGIIIYQEQIMMIAQRFAGFSLAEADILRKAVSKKNSIILDEAKNKFIAGAIKNGYNEKLALEIYELIYKFANYGFNKSHSVAYSVLAYQMAYFKANHLVIFMSKIFNNVIGNTNSTKEYINYSKEHGLNILKPDINISTSEYVYKDKNLYMPLTAIYSIGGAQANAIVSDRLKNGPFKDYMDFKNRINPSSSLVEALVFSGALDSLGKTKKQMMDNSTEADSYFYKIVGGEGKSVGEFDTDYLAEMEFKYLNMNIEYNIYSNIDNLKNKYHATALKNLQKKMLGKCIVSIKDYNVIKTKNNEDMLVGKIEDDMGICKFVIFPKTYKNINVEILKNRLYLVIGRMDSDNRGEDSFVVDSIKLIEE